METEGQCYIRLRDELLSSLYRKASEMERQKTMTPADEIEFTALDLLIIDLHRLEY